MNLYILCKTLLHLRPTQLLYQFKYRLMRPGYIQEVAPSSFRKLDYAAFPAKATCVEGEGCTFLNIKDTFTSWNDTRHGALWGYNLNYMDGLCQAGMSYEEGAEWIERFIRDLPDNRIGLDPYPIALREINWIKFICRHYARIPEERLKRWIDSLYSQYRLLERKLEFHLLGNHLLENAYSLSIASLFFADERMYRRASRLLRRELKEQVLPDGAHYEQSPMYHCILLDRLLDAYNFSAQNLRFGGQEDLNDFLREKARIMLGHLASVIYRDHSIPLLNDAAYGIAPEPDELFDYARRLGIAWEAIPMNACGYRKLENERFEAIVDVGNITASYQPGHSHADTFNYELRIDGQPFIVDTGISTYDKTPRRQYERSTAAHNTVTIDGKDTSEVWGGFRVGNRAKVTLLKNRLNEVEAWHNGFGSLGKHHRRFAISADRFEIEDTVSTLREAESWIHLAPGVTIIAHSPTEIITNKGRIEISGASEVEITEGQVSTRYNQFSPSRIVRIRFTGKLMYRIG